MTPATLKLPVTVVIAAKNESANIRACIEALGPAERVIVVDSRSPDGTPDIATRCGADVVQFSYQGGYPKKRQWALDTLDISTPWVLLLDADEKVPAELWHEIHDTVASGDVRDGYFVTKGFHFLGQRFRFGGFSHEALVLIRTGRARFERLMGVDDSGLDMEVHERVVVAGRTGRLRTPLIHEDFKGLQAYIDRHNRYSTWEAALRRQRLQTGHFGELEIEARPFGDPQERRRWLKNHLLSVPFEPWIWFVYHYWLRLGFLEGRAGLIACQLRSHYIAQVRAKVHEARLVM